MSKDNGGPASDRELLELAAKAAGIDLRWKLGVHQITLPPALPYYLVGGLDQYWNPLADDGDALRLAVKMHFDLHFYWNGCDDQYDEVEAYTHGAREDAREQIGFYLSGGQIDECAATRRAIVRAAAAIGSAM